MNQVHKLLKTEYFLYKFLSVMIIFISILILLGPSTILFFKHDMNKALFMPLTFGIGLVFVVLLRMFTKNLMDSYVSNIYKASELMDGIAPVSGNLDMTNCDRLGMLYKVKIGEETKVVQFKAPQNKLRALFSKQSPYDVQVYYNEKQDCYLLVVQLDEKNVLVGKVIDEENYNEVVEETKKIMRFATLTVSIVFIMMMITLSMIYFSMQKELDYVLASPTWPEVQAVITDSQTVKARIPRGKSGSVDGWKAQIKYDYSLDGQNFSGDKISYAYKPTINKSDADAFVQKYPNGATLSIKYNPENPKMAVLEPGKPDRLESKLLMLKILFVPIILISLIVVFIFRYMFRRRIRKIDELLGKSN